MSIFLVGGLEVFAGCHSRFLGVKTLVNLVIHLQAIIPGRAGEQLPDAGSLGAGVGVIVHRTLGHGEIEEVQGDTLLLQYLGQSGKIAVGTLETQFGGRLAVDDARQLAVQPFGHVETVKTHLLAGKRHTGRYVGAGGHAEHGRRGAHIAVLTLELRLRHDGPRHHQHCHRYDFLHDYCCRLVKRLYRSKTAISSPA